MVETLSPKPASLDKTTTASDKCISLENRNYDVYEYAVILGVDGPQVEIPHLVIVDKPNASSRASARAPKGKARSSFLTIPA